MANISRKKNLEREITLIDGNLKDINGNIKQLEDNARFLDRRAVELRNKSHNQKSFRVFWSIASVAGGLLFAPATAGVSLVAGAASAGAGAFVGFTTAEKCENEERLKERVILLRNQVAELQNRKSSLEKELSELKKKRGWTDYFL